MLRIKALNDNQSESSNSSDDSDYQTTKEAEEEELNDLYINALKYAANGNVDEAENLLLQLKEELEIDNPPKIKDAFLLKRLKYLTYKNLGLFKNDLNYIFDALEIDDTDINLWLTCGRKSRDQMNYLMAKRCFEQAFNYNPSNYVAIDNLIDLYFITENLYRCVNVCLRGLEVNNDYFKAKIILNECIRLMPPIINDMNNEHKSLITVALGGESHEFDVNEQLIKLVPQIIQPLEQLKSEYFRRCNYHDEYNRSNKRKKLQLNLNPIEHSTFEKIGQEIKTMYDYIQQQPQSNVCATIVIQFDDNHNNNNKINADNDPSQHSTTTTSNPEIDNDTSMMIDGEKLKKSTTTTTTSNNVEQHKQNEKQLLYEYADKRRSSRVKTKSRTVDSEDEQNAFETLFNLIPESMKNDNLSAKSTTTFETENISSNSISITENMNINRLIELEAVEAFYEKFKTYHSQSNDSMMNILDIIDFYLIEVSKIKNLTIPRIFMTLYRIHREQNQLPVGILCHIGRDITIDMIFVCLVANEIEYQRQETLFLKEILIKLYFHLDINEYRCFLIRFFVLGGSKELNIDYLHYALDFCQNDSRYFAYFAMGAHFSDNEPSTMNETFEVIASNKLRINEQYIQTLIDMQGVSQLNDDDHNYVEIIRLCFTKNESELTNDEKRQLYEAILKAQIWQKAIEFFENWSHFNDECFEIILRCVTATDGKKGQLTGKLLRKIVKCATEGNSVLPWLILNATLVEAIGKSADDDSSSSLIKFFKMGHNILGRRGLCIDRDGQFLLAAQKVFTDNDIDEEALLCFSCLFNFPPQKNLSPQECHTSAHIGLKWEHCPDIYLYFVPDLMPEFDSNARQTGITFETKEFFLKILSLIPEEEKPKRTLEINNYIKRGTPLFGAITTETNTVTSTLYYLLADHYFKTKDFAKAKYFYINDLSLNVDRFDSWAGLALSINYQVDQMLIEGITTNGEKFHQTAYSAIKCFEQALRLQPDNSKLWIEYGILCYNVASNWSRLRKRITVFGDNHPELIISENNFFQYEDVLEKAKQCFERITDPDINNEESWLSYYMLGKVAEKTKCDLLIILQYYEWAYLNLYLDGATYPKKINYYSPSYLSIEALEIHYRIHSCILKYLLNNRKFTARMLRQLKYHLIKVNKSPFVLRKIFSSSSAAKKQQTSNGSKNSQTNSNDSRPTTMMIREDERQIMPILTDIIGMVAERKVKFDANHYRNELIKMCLQGIKKCLARYNAHYKSYYRLAYYYYSMRDYYTAKSIMFGGPENKSNNLLRFEIDPDKPNSNPGYINGLFIDHKSANLYNGIWCIPVDEIERAGNFNAHMFRCTNLMIDICTKTEDYNQLSKIAIGLYKKPDPDKKYVNHNERLLLSRKAFDNCFAILEQKIIDAHNACLPVNIGTIIVEIRRIAQSMEKFNTFPNETQQKCQQIGQYLENSTTTTTQQQQQQQ
ncbi:Calcineurin-binding protein cabin-1 [Dermatophagoides farinae]|uniref:Calcineurin-binding protein cabin-1 n=1 Tax=Dermatophagoides farinae TaxID=6954 RepID=A0A922HMP3_DERFA|nr:Calcineurin-binding protein cabin-1 [Dermatophagoides farinae]